MIRSTLRTFVADSRAVLQCYDVLDLALDAGVCDFTEGVYRGRPDTSYEAAQQNQAEHLLDLVGCGRGNFLLDIGCGYGRILESAERRGATARGITISPAQAEHCTASGLDARLLDYRDAPDSWRGLFDGVIANGSLEHFVQPREAAQGRSDDIYRRMFDIVYKLFADRTDGGLADGDRTGGGRADGGRADGGRFVTTAIHFDNVRIDPRDMLRPPSAFRRGTAEHHYALLVHGFGGFYPYIGQLERCAAGRFVLFNEEDGTEDYRITSEQWLSALKSAMRRPRFLRRVLAKWWRYPRQTRTLLDCLLFAQSWNWQFRGRKPPMRLLRQTWRRMLPNRARAPLGGDRRAQELSAASALP